jgi:hypothetical protein
MTDVNLNQPNQAQTGTLNLSDSKKAGQVYEGHKYHPVNLSVEKITKLRVLKVERITDGQHRVDLQVEVSGVPEGGLPSEAVEFSKEVPATGAWATWFKSLGTDEMTQKK